MTKKPFIFFTLDIFKHDIFGAKNFMFPRFTKPKKIFSTLVVKKILRSKFFVGTEFQRAGEGCKNACFPDVTVIGPFKVRKHLKIPQILCVCLSVPRFDV